MSGILTSRIARGLFGPMSYVASICFGVCLYHSLLEYNILQQWVAPDLDWPTINLNSSGIFSISTFALSLLLVFRTNSSYERWWEARDCWRMIVNECTHLARQTEQWLPGPASEPVRSALLRWLHVFPISLMVHLRGHEEDLRQEVQGLLPSDELELLLRARNPPLLVLSAIGQIMAVSEMRIESKTHMDESVRVLQESLGSCEKLLTTPIPLSYTRHTGRFLVLWLTCLPFVIWQELGWLSVPISMVVSFLLFGIEEIGVQIEEPFGILALESYCDEVKAGINQATADANALLPITLKLTGGKVSDCLPGDFALQQLQLQELAGTAAAAAAGATAGQLQQGLSLQQLQQAQQLQQVQQAQQLVQAVAVNGASHSHSTQHHQ
uniref:Uncharacterized protein n=1 Tax=Tetradesmus obliquus TaxID=3088 RepID=A0A383VJ70_TETOB|eukprot:jgi/Sobl393_1/4175/SZX65565.1